MDVPTIVSPKPKRRVTTKTKKGNTNNLIAEKSITPFSNNVRISTSAIMAPMIIIESGDTQADILMIAVSINAGKGNCKSPLAIPRKTVTIQGLVINFIINCFLFTFLFDNMVIPADHIKIRIGIRKIDAKIKP